MLKELWVSASSDGLRMHNSLASCGVRRAGLCGKLPWARLSLLLGHAATASVSILGWVLRDIGERPPSEAVALMRPHVIPSRVPASVVEAGAGFASTIRGAAVAK